jgi:exopolyphosphatase / guanosine-5'-triphosphate,3'-diphosphate pyrophosphatase
LTERFMRHDPPAPKDLKKLQKWLKMKLEPLSKKIQNLSPELAVGTSGTILAMGALVAENRKNGKSKLQKDVMTLTEVELVNEKLQSMTMDQRMKLPSLDRKRADQIVAGGILIETVMEKCRMNEMTLCERALREGLIADFLIRRTPSVPAKIQARDLRGRSVLNLLNRWEIDRKHAEYTSKLALQLFDALANVHQMGPFEREVMEYSALLHDIGRVISYPGHHKHGWYIVKNANLVGFQVEELEMIAAIVRYHRKKAPKKKDNLLRPLPKRMRRAVILLSAILRIVDGLDRQHNQSIIQIEAKCETPRILRITLISDEPVPIALRAGLERAALLQKVLKIKRLEFGNEVSQSGIMKTETK